MKNKLTGIIFLTISLFLTVTLQANIQLPALVGDNMVLQQNEKINLWGWADVNEKVSVEFPGQEWSTQTGKDGKWEIVLNPMKAGGPYDITIKGKFHGTSSDIMPRLVEKWEAAFNAIYPEAEFEITPAENERFQEERRAAMVLAHVQMAHDVLAHHDRVVDQQSDAQRQRHHRHEVQREAERVDGDEA